MTSICFGATRDPELIKKIGAATALEVRATGVMYAFAPCIAVIKEKKFTRNLVLEHQMCEKPRTELQ